MVRTYMETRRLRLAVSRPRDWSREDFPSSSTTKFHRESKILSRVQREEKISIWGKYGNFLIETEIPHSRDRKCQVGFEAIIVQ